MSLTFRAQALSTTELCEVSLGGVFQVRGTSNPVNNSEPAPLGHKTDSRNRTAAETGSRTDQVGIPVLVFGSSLTAIGVIRTLGRARIPALSVCSTPGIIAQSRWYRPLPELAGTDPQPPDLAKILEGLSIQKAVLMPCADDWAEAVAQLPDRLKDRFPASISPAHIIEMMVDKWHFAGMLQRENIPHPRTMVLQSLEEMEALPASYFDGAFLKPLDSLSFTRRHQVKAFLIRDKADAIATMSGAQQKGNNEFPILLQEYIPGPPTNHYFVDGFVDRAGTIQTLFPRRRLRMFPPLLGNSTLMESIGLDEVEGATESLRKMWSALPFRGIFSAEFKYDDRDGLFKILEVNARPWWYIEFATRAGVDVCSLAYRDALGMTVAPIEKYHIGRRCVYLPKDYKAFRNDHGNLFTWLRSIAGADGAVFAWDDPGPALSYIGDVLKGHLPGQPKR